MHDFLDNLGAQQYEKMRERNATKEEITNTCEETYGKKSLSRRNLLRLPKPKEKNSKTPSTHRKSTVPGKLKRKKLPPEEMHPFSAFPYRLEYKDGTDTRICHFECEEHRDKHIKRYKLRKGSFFIDNLT